MRLSRPIYESLPYAYVGVGLGGLLLSYIDTMGSRCTVAFCFGMIAVIAGLTISLRRHDYRARQRALAKTGQQFGL